ncbi:MAG TPA: EF-hand domain-containing protein [Lysobacter sp.]
MNQFSRKSLIGTLALVASLSAPLAFAQSADASAQQAPPTETSTPPTDAASTTQSPTSTEATAGAETSTSNDATATTSAEPAKKSWADVDMDKDGKLSKTEAATVPALGQVFDQADADADGSLTADEYKSYVAKVQGGENKDAKQ